MVGYYSLGLCGYVIIAVNDEFVRWKFSGGGGEEREHATKIYYTSTNRPYFRAYTGRVYLDECIKN